MRDAIVIGGGIAGMSAAWRMRYSDILVLEASNRIGGRLRSERRGKYWLNWGGHVFAGEGSFADKLLKEVGVDALNLSGELSALSFKGKTLIGGNVNLYPFKVPISWKSRWEIVRGGLKLIPAVKRYAKVCKPREGEDYRVRQQRIYDFMADQTFSDFTGKLSPDADAFFRPTVSRSSGDPEEVSAGAGIGYFLLVWDKNAGLARNIVGGSATLPQAIAHKLGPEVVQMGAEVLEVVQHDDHVEVTYKQGGKEKTEKARYCVMTTPATITHKVTKNLNPIVHEALSKVQYGHYVSAAFLTNEKGPQSWDNVYAYCTPQRSFNIAFNMSNLVRSMESERDEGSSFMVFSPAALARNLINRPDEEVMEIYLKDLEEVFPRFRDIMVEGSVQKFHNGLAYCFPGRNKLQPKLMHAPKRIYLAGDYLGSWYTETAIQTGLLAGEDINSKLYTDMLLPSNNFFY